MQILGRKISFKREGRTQIPQVPLKKAPTKKRYAAVHKAKKLGMTGRGGALSADELIRANLPQLVRSSRQLSHDNPHYKKFLRLCRTNIVGPHGFTFQSQVVTPSGVPDTGANDEIERWWRDFGRPGQFDVTGELSRSDFFRLAVVSVARDGEVFVRRIKGFDNDTAFAFQLIEADQVDMTYSEDLANGNIVTMGIERDEWGRPVAYYVLTEHPGNFRGRVRAKRIRVPAEDIKHLKDPWRIGQSRGVPWGHASVLDLWQMGEYRQTELTGARAASSKMGVYEPDPDLEPVLDAETGEEIDEGEFVEEVEGGLITVAPLGYKLRELNWNYPNSNFAPFSKTGLQSSAAGLGPSYASVSGDLEGVNFSSIRQGVLEDRDLWMELQDYFIEHLAKWCFEQSLPFAYLSGQLNLPRWDPAYYIKPYFQGRRWDWVDPLKDEKANTEAQINGRKSPQQIIRAAGGDPEQVFSDIAKLKKDNPDIFDLIYGKKDGSGKDEADGDAGSENSSTSG